MPNEICILLWPTSEGVTHIKIDQRYLTGHLQRRIRSLKLLKNIKRNDRFRIYIYV